MVEDIADGDAVLDLACTTAQRLATIPADAFALSKRQIRQPAAERMRTMAEEFDADVLEIWSRPETLDGIRAFLEKTVGKK